jgi:hypothetical protein
VVCPAKFEGAGSLKIFTLEENPGTGQCIKLRTGQHRVRRATPCRIRTASSTAAKVTSIMFAICTACGGKHSYQNRKIVLITTYLWGVGRLQKKTE